MAVTREPKHKKNPTTNSAADTKEQGPFGTTIARGSKCPSCKSIQSEETTKTVPSPCLLGDRKIRIICCRTKKPRCQKLDVPMRQFPSVEKNLTEEKSQHLWDKPPHEKCPGLQGQQEPFHLWEVLKEAEAVHAAHRHARSTLNSLCPVARPRQANSLPVSTKAGDASPAKQARELFPCRPIMSSTKSLFNSRGCKRNDNVKLAP